MAPFAFALALLCPFLFLGVAAQAAGLYAFGIALPAVVVLGRRSFPRTAVKPTLVLAACFLVAWGVFPGVNLLLAHADVPARIAGVYERVWPERAGKVLASRFSSAWLATGLSLLVIGLFGRIRLARSVALDEAHATLLPAFRMFLRALLVCVVVWVAWLTFQHATGFDPRSPTGVLEPEHRMAGGLYRVFGFYGHPLSVAGTALSLFAFFWFLTWSYLEGQSYANLHAKRELSSEPKERTGALSRRHPWIAFRLFPSRPGWLDALCYLVGAAAAMLAVVESGGRTALAAALVLCAALPFSVRLRGRYGIVRLAGAAAALCASLLVVFASNITTRIEALLSALERGQVENRVHFWKTYFAMIGDSPFLGHGAHWIETGLRDAYYGVLGFQKLQEKFNAHNIYLETVANVGMAGTVVIVAALYWMLRTLSGLAKDAQVLEPRLLVRALGASVIANLLHSFTQNVFFDTNVLVPYLALFWATYWLAVVGQPFAHAPASLRDPSKRSKH